MGLGPPDTFWRLTPRLVFIALRGGQEAAEEARQGRIATAWWIENMSRAGKSLKALDHYTRPASAPVEEQTEAQQIAAAMAWHRQVSRSAAG